MHINAVAKELNVVNVFGLFLAFGVAHQAVEEVDPSGDTILIQG